MKNITNYPIAKSHALTISGWRLNGSWLIVNVSLFAISSSLILRGIYHV